MSRPRTCLIAFIAAVVPSSSTAQSPGTYTLWHTYFAAGAQASRAKNWSEAETLYTAAANQAEECKPSEPLLTIARYSLTVTYWEEGRHDEAVQTSQALKLTLESAQVTPELRDAVDMLTRLGQFFYDEAETETERAAKLQGDAFQKAKDAANQNYHFARRYFLWAFVIQRRFVSPNSSELEDTGAWLGLASFNAGEYADAIESLTQLRELHRALLQRKERLSTGSAEYSLLERKIGHAEDKLNPAALSPATVNLLISMSYERRALELAKDKPAEASKDLANAESNLKESLGDAESGSDLRLALARMYEEHAAILRRLNKEAEAGQLEREAKQLRSKASS